MRAFTQFIQRLYSENQAQYPDSGQTAIRDLRQKAMDLFLQKELPDKRLQGWQQSVLNKKVKTDYIQKLQPVNHDHTLDEVTQFAKTLGVKTFDFPDDMAMSFIVVFSSPFLAKSCRATSTNKCLVLDMDIMIAH